MHPPRWTVVHRRHRQRTFFQPYTTISRERNAWGGGVILDHRVTSGTRQQGRTGNISGARFFFCASICEDSVESPELALANAHLVTCELAGGRFVLISESTLLNALLPEHHGAARTAAEPGSGRRCVPDYYCFSPLPALKVGPDSGLGCDCVVYSDEDMDLVRQQV